MFECCLSGIIFKRLLESLKEICTDVNLECHQHGMTMQAMDSSHVALVHLHLSLDFFQEYRCDHGAVLGVNIPHMLKILNIVKDQSQVFLSKTDDEDQDALQISILDVDNVNQDEEMMVPNSQSDIKRAESLTIDLKMIDMEKEHLDIPESSHTCTCTMKSKRFQEIVKYLNSVGDAIKITIEKQYLILEAEGESIKVKKQFKHMINDVVVTSIKSVTEEFASRYLMMFSRASSISEHVTLGLSEGIPLSLRFGISAQGSREMDSDDGSNISFFLAPKIDED